MVKRLHLGTRAAIDGALAPHGISTAQYSALRRLHGDGELTGAELARQLYVTAQTMSRLLASLERAGLIERVEASDSPNAVHNRLTARGEAVVTECRKIVQGIADAVLDPLSHEERRCFQEALVRCTEAAERLASAAPEEAAVH
jgi:DNA-binding MarR family transcriptional regulator